MTVLFWAVTRCDRCGVTSPPEATELKQDYQAAARLAHLKAARAGWFDLGESLEHRGWRRMLCPYCAGCDVGKLPPLADMLKDPSSGLPFSACSGCGKAPRGHYIDSSAIGLENAMICDDCAAACAGGVRFYELVFMRRLRLWRGLPMPHEMPKKPDPTDESMFTLEESNG